MTRSVLIALLVVTLSYGTLEAWPLLAGPALSVSAPAEGTVSPDGVVTVSGRATRVALLTLDGAPLLHDEQGNFKTTLALPRGGTILSLTATDRFGRSVTVRRDVYTTN